MVLMSEDGPGLDSRPAKTFPARTNYEISAVLSKAVSDMGVYLERKEFSTSIYTVHHSHTNNTM